MALQLRQNLNMRMEQKLKLTPQMIQSIEILLLPQMALEERIMTEVESNPALEIADEADDVRNESDEEVARGDVRADGERRNEVVEYRNTQDEDGAAYGDWLKKRRQYDGDDDAPDKMAAINAAADRPQPLAEVLIDQLRFDEMSAAAREIAEDICWQLDKRGYLTIPLDELVEEEQLEDAEEAWEHVRACDPAGIGARDLRDCLLLQLEREHGDNTFEIHLIRDHLDDVLRNRLPVIAQALGVDIQRVQEGVEVIARLDPQPGLQFGASENHYVVPDAIIERDKDGEWTIEIPDGNLPKVRVSDTYNDIYQTVTMDSREREYLKEKLGQARFIIDAVAQRRRTLLRIVSEIVKHQRQFLEQGPEYLRPLMRQDIANIIGMHVATVSRAVKDKYVQTPSGVLPLASFFSGGISSQDGGEAESSRVVRMKINQLIENENKHKPLSDQAIADQLAKDGLSISRRTVTKYRIADGIPSTRQRRVY